MAVGDTGGQLRRTLRELGDCAIERSPITRIHSFQQLTGKIERGRRELQVNIPSRRGEREECFAQISLRRSSNATARDTLVLCMWLWAPIALAVIAPNSPSVTSTRHSGTPIL